ncbi:MAG: hypothetical protein K2F83_01950 [Oscillospiraceae bacterium]|nr:hypothetical protein [Oscillospiraceae bacterium]
MSGASYQFRTAAVGGFQKQDVQAYLEKSAKEHQEQLAQLKKELSEERSARAEDMEAFDGLKSAAEAVKEENARLSAALQAREEELAQLQARCEALENQLTGSQVELERLGPAAASYEAIKNRTASIELEAHGRAQVIEEEARKKAQKTREELLEWVDKMQNAYIRVRADMDDTVGRVVQELQLSGSRIESVVESFSDYDAALNALRGQVAGMEPKLPQPFRAEEPKEEQ